MGTVLLRFLVGGVAGLVAWAIWEPSYPKTLSVESPVELYMVITAGLLIGLGVGGLTGYAQGSRRHTLMGLLLGAIFGCLGMTFGYRLGGTLTSAMFGPAVFLRMDVPEAERVIARTLAIAPIGLCLGAAVGASTLNLKRTTQGAIGGLLGGLAAGLVFDPLALIVGPVFLALQAQRQGDVATASRALTFLLLGSLVALFIGLVDRLARSAWLRLQLGRNEGKEWSIDAPNTYIGRSEGANVPLFGDPNVAPIHASIQKQGPTYVLADAGSHIGTYLDGQRIQVAPLRHGSQIQIGSFLLVFLMKNQPAPLRGPEAYVGQAYSIAPQGAYQPQGAAPAVPFAAAPTQAFPTPTVAYTPPSRGFSLVAIDGPLLGQRFPVGAPTEVGRECPSIPLGFDGNASRRHAQLTPSVSGIAVQDLGSTNGTFLNGQRVQSAQAAPGDLIKIGSTTFRVES